MFKLFRENIRVALGSIRTQLLRTVLTVLIIAIGIMALVGILTVVAALENELTSNFASMGANTFTINQYDYSSRSSEEEKPHPAITFQQARDFKERFSYPFSTCSLSFAATSSAEVRYESEKTDPEITIMGVDNLFITNSGLEIQSGRDFTGFDIENNNYTCILGSDFLKGLFKNTQPIGKTISIRGARFKVIGVLKERGSTFGNSQDLRVFIPIQIARSLFSMPNTNYTISVMAGRNELLNAAVDNATITMRDVRKLSPVEQNDFGVVRSDDLINRVMEISVYLDGAAFLISIITIFGSSIALMNIMIVSVTERTREIGVRKALGAKKTTIAVQFFIETLVIGQLGGFVGSIFGLLIGYIISSFIGFAFVIPWGAIVWAFVVSFLVAIASGLYPAIKAAKLDPIEALRYE
ncbi:ABC transporter permease [Flavobacterium pallidum]|uniref:ABC transporter permease n=1 Tax=Flavobacterium pallidum TaxID=2172098 RepID=A0A2S1SL58_9FLAO|nr:ABC transporter permease [Flavobacterium pallidum]AWI27111.1 ABC transporter permease [Flavobacterium pallidum]